ncbi:tail fiber assembly protein, partial [Salmonella enterica]|nr:tail fiber assembly protein [Salmonella enterica]ECR8717696.1 tail fiber assembly protein [Salmonella enterica]
EEVENVITPLARVVKLGIATDEERSRLEIWEICSVMVNGVDTPRLLGNADYRTDAI